MSFPEDTDLDAVCPYLGLADDAESHATYATEAHRCYRLPNPTRIASGHQQTYCLGANHPTCPVYQGEGVPQTTATAGAAPRQPAAPPQPTGAVRGPAGPRGQRPRPGAGPQRPGRQRPAGSLGPRPRAGGISMPAATIGLFALAIAIVALAFIIQRVLSGGGDDDLPPADVFATQSAVQTQTAAAGGGQTPVPTSETPDGDGTPGNDQTPTDGETPTPGGETPGGGTTTYTVQEGDFCSTIAAEFGVTVEQIIEANDLDDECTILVGQELIIPQ